MIPVIVLGGDITALGVIRSFARRGVSVYGTTDSTDYIRRSRYYRVLPRLSRACCGRGYETPEGVPNRLDALVALLESSGLDRAVLCPCSDHACMAVATLPEPLSKRFPSSLPTADTLALINDKGRFARLLDQLGVDHPWTRLVHGPDDLDDSADMASAGLFLKPRDSQSFFRQYAVKAFRVTSLADARVRLAEIARHGLGVILQEYVPGPPNNHYFVDGFRDASGTLRAVFARRRLRIYPPDFGNSTAMVSIDPVLMSDAIDGLRRIFRATQYRGIFSAEFKRDVRDGRYKILEINTRPWWYVDFAVRSGVDVCAMAYQDALGEPVDTVTDYRVGSRCIYPYGDLLAVRQLREQGARHSWLRWLAELARAKQPVFAWDDAMPAVVASMRTVSASRLKASARLVMRARGRA